VKAFERVKAALNLAPVDRVPNMPFYEAPICNYFSDRFSAALLEGEEIAKVHLKALETYDFDWVIVGMGLIGAIIPEALGCRVSYPPNVFPIIEEPSIQTTEDVDSVPRCDLMTPRMESFLDGIRRLKNALGDDVPVGCEYISPFSVASRVLGDSQLMEDIYGEPQLVRDLQAALVPVDISIGQSLIDAGVDIIFYGADMECPLLISPQHYREFVDGPTTQVVNALSAAGAIVLDHMCGDIVKTGIVDIIMQMLIRGIMPGNLTQEKVLDLSVLKAKVGNRICIFDNLNPNGNLLLGSPEEVEAEVKAHVEKAKGWRGYAFTTAGTTSANTPKPNFDAMNAAVLQYGKVSPRPDEK